MKIMYFLLTFNLAQILPFKELDKEQIITGFWQKQHS